MLVPAEEDQTETMWILGVNEEDRFHIAIDQVKRRGSVHLAASPTRTNFLRQSILIMTEVAKLNIEKDGPIDVIYDHTEAKPVQPNLKVIMFTRALGAGMLFPNVQTWRVIPGDPAKNGFLRKFSRGMSSCWLPVRINEKVFQSVEQAERYLDEFRIQEPKKIGRNTGRRLKQMTKDRGRVEVSASRSGKTDSAKWKDRTIKSLTYAQLRIRDLCNAYMKGEITPEEFEQELPRVLDVRDREKRNLNS